MGLEDLPAQPGQGARPGRRGRGRAAVRAGAGGAVAGRPAGLGWTGACSVRTALVLGGTGMLAGCAQRLVERGWHVVLPSRTQPLMADDGPGRAARASISRGHRPTWVRANWEKPAELASEVEYELQGRPVNLLVAWVHDTY